MVVSAFFSLGRLLFQSEVLQEGLRPFSSMFLELLRYSWERQRFLLRRVCLVDFRRWSIRFTISGFCPEG